MMKETVYTFDEQMEKQKECFNAFVEWLQRRNNVLAVTIADKEEELRGIDLWEIKQGAEPIPMQVKVDFKMHRTGNMAVETVSYATYDGDWKPGWLSHLHSTRFLVYICGITGDFCIFRSQEFYRQVLKHYNGYRSFKALNGSEDGSTFWNSLGALVPEDSMSEWVVYKGNINDRHTDTAMDAIVA